MAVVDRAKRMEGLVLQRLQSETTQTAIAAAMGTSIATVNRTVNDHLAKLCLIMAHLGLKIVPVENVSVDPETYRAICHIATKAMSHREVAEQIVLEDH